MRLSDYVSHIREHRRCEGLLTNVRLATFVDVNVVFGAQQIVCLCDRRVDVDPTLCRRDLDPLSRDPTPHKPVMHGREGLFARCERLRNLSCSPVVTVLE